LMNVIIINEVKYSEMTQKAHTKTGKTQIPFETYQNRMILWIIAATLLVAIQTSIPGHRVKKTFPGCSRSFSGFPLTSGVEDTSAIDYIACVMNKLKSSISPWNSIAKLKKDLYAIRIKDVIDKYIISNRPDIMELYTIKQKYIIEHPDEIIPDEHSIDKWHTFLPPVVPFHIASIQTISSDFEKDFLDSVRKGHKDQRNYINILNSKAILFGFDTIECINKIVAKKDPLLKTASYDPFLENGCCDTSDTSTVIQYFVNENPLIKRNNTVGKVLHEMLSETRSLSRPSILHHNDFTGIRHSIITDSISDEHIYGAFIHYCNFNNDLPIPIELISVCPEKPDGFPTNASIIDKMDFLKKNGRRYTVGDLNNLMTIIRKQNIGSVENNTHFTQINVLYDILDSFDNNDSHSIEPKLREHLRNVLGTYKKGVMVSTVRDELKSCKTYLYNANKKMFNEIVLFLNEYGNLTTSKFNTTQDMLLNIYDADKNNNNINNNTTHITNMIQLFTRTFPEMILNGKLYDVIHKHWLLSQIHVKDLSKTIEKHWKNIQQFHGDKTLTGLLKHINSNTRDLYLLLNVIPLDENITKNGGDGSKEVFYSVFDNETIKYINQYLFYSTLYEYIIGANDPDLLSSDIELKKEKRRNMNDENNDDALQTRGIEHVSDIDVQEVDISMTDENDLKQRVAHLLITFLDIEQDNRKCFVGYDEISNKIHKAKIKEKQKIVTEDLGKLDNDVRRVETQLKKYKMGRWNIGLQRGLVHYDADTYDRERMEMDGNELISEDVEQLDAIAEEEITEEYDNEGNDITMLGEDYMDGNYYGDENMDNDFGDI